ncbi:hypothetical protein AAMO2058_000648200 [Amorphochlora amoebiformis]
MLALGRLRRCISAVHASLGRFRGFCSASQVKILDVRVQKVTAENIEPYGTLFEDFDGEAVRLEQWPQPGRRPVIDGVSGGVTEGDFSLEWNNGTHIAENTAVQDGVYSFAWDGGDEALQAAGWGISSPCKSSCPSAYMFTEINYHACGSQLFYSKHEPFVLMVAKPSEDRFPDEVFPEDFLAFYCPEGSGVNVNAFVWHSPPVSPLFNRKIVMKTKQAAVHSKIYYDPLKEHSTLLRVALREPIY